MRWNPDEDSNVKLDLQKPYIGLLLKFIKMKKSKNKNKNKSLGLLILEIE